MKYIKSFAIIIILCLLFYIIFSGKPCTKTGFYFDTIVTITIYDKFKDSLIDDCFEICDDYHKKFSFTDPNSEVSMINNSNGKSVKVSDETIALLKQAKDYSELTNGYFDITIASLSTLWNFNTTEKDVPDLDKIRNGITHINYENIEIVGNHVALKDPLASIDLGGIAKGYIADQLKEYLTACGVKYAIINVGGNVQTIGSKPNGTPFNIGIEKPFSEGSETIRSVSILDTSVVTAGIYQRYFEKDGRIYHHIIDPFTGFPSDSDLISVTVLSSDSALGDALSTAFVIMGYEKSRDLLRELDGIEAIFITDNYEVIDSRN